MQIEIKLPGSAPILNQSLFALNFEQPILNPVSINPCYILAFLDSPENLMIH